MKTTFEALSGWYTNDASERSGPQPEKVTEAFVAPRLLELWGVSPALARDFTPDEEHFGGPKGVLISDGFWRGRSNADLNAVGKRLRVEKYSYTMVGAAGERQLG